MMKAPMEHYDRIKLGVLVLLVASLPFYFQISNVLIGIGAFLTILKAWSQKSWKFISLESLSIVMISFFILDVIGLLYTEKENLKTGLFTLDKHQAFILMPLIFSDFELAPKSREMVLAAFVGSCFAASLICVGVNMYESITHYDQYFHEWLFSHDRVSDPIGMHAVYFAMYLGLSILILLNVLKEKYSRLSKIKILLLAILLICMLMVIIALGARTVTVSLVLIILINLILYARQRRSAKMYIFAAIVPFIFAGFIFLNPVVKTRFLDMLKQNYESSNYGSYFARSHIWVPGIDAIRENILIGAGTGDSQAELNKKYMEHNYPEGVELDFNMHSQYLQSALNFGLVGVVLFLFAFYIQAREGLRKQDYLYLSFLSLFMLACITEAMLVVNKGTIFFLVFSFIFFKSKKPSQEI